MKTDNNNNNNNTNEKEVKDKGKNCLSSLYDKSEFQIKW